MALTKVRNELISGAYVNVLDYGAMGNGTADDTSAIQAAINASAGSTVYFPKGTYLVSNIGGLNYAGTRLVGESKYTSVISVKSGTTGSIISNTNSAAGTSAFCEISNFKFDLNTINVIAVDLSSMNNCVVHNCSFEGGTSFGTATGTGVLFKAPLLSGAYNNLVSACTFTYLSVGVDWQKGANLQQVYASECISCTVGFSSYQAVTGVNGVDAPTIVGGRTEGCGIGLKEGATAGGYFNVRFENNSTADIEFHTSSYAAFISGGYTAVTSTVLKDITNANDPTINSSELGYYELQSSASRPKRVSGRVTFAAAGQTPTPITTPTNYSVHFQDYTVIRNEVFHEHLNAAGNNTIIGVGLNSSDVLVVSGYNRGTSSYGDIDIGGGNYVRPITNGSTNLGQSTRRWDTVYAAVGTINTSDQNEKQQIRDLSDAESSVASEIKSLIKAFKFNSAVESKSDDARIHVGVIAQEVKSAFQNHGLNAHNYALFCEDTFYVDSDGVEHLENANGRTESKRLGIRYSELLAFIISTL